MELAVLQNAEQLMYQRTLFVNAFPDMITLNTWVREVWEEAKDVLEEAELAFALGQPGPRQNSLRRPALRGGVGHQRFPSLPRPPDRAADMWGPIFC